MAQESQNKFLMTVVVVLAVGVTGYFLLNAPDRRTPGERIGDAVDQLGDRTPAQKLGDAVKGH
jgi:hypothetical protein